MATFADSSPIVTVSSAVTVDTDGDWVELFLSTSKEYKWMIVSLALPGLPGRALFDIGTGAPGNQIDDVLQDQYAKYIRTGGDNVGLNAFSFPMSVTLGSRLWIRIKDNRALIQDYRVVVTLSTIPLSTILPTSSEAFATAGGVESPASFDVFGSWVTMFPALEKDRSWLCLVIYSFSGGNFDARLDLGSGDPQTVDWGELYYRKRSGSSFQGTGLVYNVPVTWAAGTKVSIRVKDSSSSIKFYSVGAILL